MSQEEGLPHGGRPSKKGGKRKGVEDYVLDYPEDFRAHTTIRDGKEIQILVCSFCCQTVGARSDRIKEHLMSNRHLKMKMQRSMEAQEVGGDLESDASALAGREFPLQDPRTETLGLGLPAGLLQEIQRQRQMDLISGGEGSAMSTLTPASSMVYGSPSLSSPASTDSGPSNYAAGDFASSGSSSRAPQEDFKPEQLLKVKWGSFGSNTASAFLRFLSQGKFVDVTLWCEGKTIRCHKVVLAASSVHLENLLVEHVHPDPVIFLKGMRFWEVQALVEFMYRGEVTVRQDELQDFIGAAESLQVKGLISSPSKTEMEEDVKSEENDIMFRNSMDKGASSGRGMSNGQFQDQAASCNINSNMMTESNPSIPLLKHSGGLNLTSSYDDQTAIPRSSTSTGLMANVLQMPMFPGPDFFSAGPPHYLGTHYGSGMGQAPPSRKKKVPGRRIPFILPMPTPRSDSASPAPPPTSTYSTSQSKMKKSRAGDSATVTSKGSVDHQENSCQNMHQDQKYANNGGYGQQENFMEAHQDSQDEFAISSSEHDQEMGEGEVLNRSNYESAGRAMSKEVSSYCQGWKQQ